MNQRTRKMVGIGVLTAIVVVLQCIAAFIKPTGIFSITLSLIPMVVGAALYGWKAGAWLGFVFGAMVLITGDAAAFLAVDVPGTIVTVLVKGTLAGALAGIVYLKVRKLGKKVCEKRAEKGLKEKKNFWNIFSAVLAGLVCPIVNTGIFLIGCNIFFYDTISGWGSAAGYENAGTYLILGMVGVNFIIEVVVNMVLTPTITQIVGIVRREGK